MAKRRGTKLQRHLAHLRDTGQLTEWLQRRMTWDTNTTELILAEMWEPSQDWLWEQHLKYYTNIQITNPRSLVRITGLSVP